MMTRGFHWMKCSILVLFGEVMMLDDLIDRTREPRTGDSTLRKQGVEHAIQSLIGMRLFTSDFLTAAEW